MEPFIETFPNSGFSPELKWWNPPSFWSTTAETGLTLVCDPETDFWQGTHYGFRVDNGHFLSREIEGNFIISTKVRFFPQHQYDQAGLMIRYNSDFWIKTSIEFEPEEESRLGVVVTRHGFSDWSTQNVSKQINEIEYRIGRNSDDYTVEFRFVDGEWTQIRMSHLEKQTNAPLHVGLYACSPKAAGFRAEFKFLKILPAQNH